MIFFQNQTFQKLFLLATVGDNLRFLKNLPFFILTRGQNEASHCLSIRHSMASYPLKTLDKSQKHSQKINGRT